MKKIALAAATIALAFGATAAQAAPKANTQKFSCKNGATVTLKRLGNDQVRIHVSTIGASTVLKAAPTGSGERYIASKGFYKNGTEFAFKGKEGSLTFTDPYKNVVETACRSK